MQPYLRITNIQKKYKQKNILTDINFEIFPNEIVGLVGLNGAGKSTIIKTICGLIKPDGGNITICGSRLQDNYFLTMQNVGSMIDTPKFYNYLTARQNLYLLCMLLGLHQERILETIEIVGLKKSLHKKVGEFSQGMKQRLGIAQALLNKPKLLILDEPTNALDPKGISDIRKLLTALAQKGTSILISSHNVDEIKTICNRIVVINSGNVVADVEVKSFNNKSEKTLNKFILEKL
jgi:ABC-2 type transport system ATP-binding protein